HVDELEQLLGDLLERLRLDVDHDRDAAEPIVVGRRDRQRVDVEPTPGEQAGDAREHTRLVLDEDRERVVRALLGHHLPPSPCDGSRMMLSLDPPAGTIGYTFSVESVRKSMTTGR